MNNAQIKVLYNYDLFDPSKYGEEFINKRSKFQSRQFRSDNPSFATMKTSIHATEDEANFVNLGQLKEKNYM